MQTDKTVDGREACEGFVRYVKAVANAKLPDSRKKPVLMIANRLLEVQPFDESAWRIDSDAIKEAKEDALRVQGKKGPMSRSDAKAAVKFITLKLDERKEKSADSVVSAEEAEQRGQGVEETLARY